MRSISYVVTVTFQDNINDDNEITEVAQNIAKAICERAETGNGISPDNSETFTKSVVVSHQGIEEANMDVF